jgi:hypothetical protein
MSHFLFAAAELAPLLRQQGRRFTTGYLHLHLRGEDPAEGTEPWVLTYYHGRLLFSADQPLNAPILLRRLSRFIPRLNLDWPQRVIRVLQQRLLPDNSLPELLEMMTELGLIKPGELEDALWLNLLTDFDRYLFECAPHRSRERWAELKVAIPTLLAVPVVNWECAPHRSRERVNRYRLSDEQRQKLHALTKDGQSLEAIAQKLCREMCSAPLTRSAGGS